MGDIGYKLPHRRTWIGEPFTQAGMIRGPLFGPLLCGAAHGRETLERLRVELPVALAIAPHTNRQPIGVVKRDRFGVVKRCKG